MLLAVGLARLMIWIDATQDPSSVLPPDMTNTNIDGARTILSVIAQSMIGVAGVTFSITMVAVAHASANFGPRLIGNFMRDRGTQWSLGILISTFVYALLVLRSVQAPIDGEVSQFVPQLSIVVAMGLALLCVATVIYYVHHVPETINVSNIAEALGRKLIHRLERTAHDEELDQTVTEETATSELTLNYDGYVQQLNVEDLAEIAKEDGLSVHIVAAPGVFVIAGTPIALMSAEPSDACGTALRRCFALGKERTEDQDVLFLIAQQVEMLARALSPGVNDPYTAINCLNWLAAGLAAADRSGQYFGLEGRETTSVPPLTWQRLLDASFHESWAYVQADALAREHWFALLDRMSVSDANRDAIRRMLAQCRETAE